MDHLAAMPSADFYEKLRIRWGLNDEPNVSRANYTAIIIDNQERHFLQLAEEVPGAAVKLLEWRGSLYDALKKQLRTHPLLDLCSIQPMTGPIGCVYWWQPKDAGMVEMEDPNTGKKISVPQYQLDIEDLAIAAEARKVKISFADAIDDSLRGWWAQKPSMDMWVEELLTDISRHVVADMLNSMTEATTNSVEGGADLKEALSQTSGHVHQTSQRAPANRLIASDEMLIDLGVDTSVSNNIGTGHIQDLGVQDGRRVFCDPFFPQRKALVWYQGEDSMDTGLIFSPYVLAHISATSLEPPKDMCVSRSVRIRSKTSLVRTEFARLLQVGEHEKTATASTPTTK